VGALTGAPTRFFGRTWEIGHTPSVCTGCSTGCNVRVDTRHGSEVVRLWSRENPATDDGWLCDPGRFGFGFVNEGRLEEPLVESGGQGVPATWSRPSPGLEPCWSGTRRRGRLESSLLHG
jgi:NADH dehydrogenase/NADH:ubiquinone oxidoreductase subunit G